MKFLKDLFQATILAALFGGPLFIYMIFFWKP
jgi:ABC-type Fe3+-siderophore transport system permease subunit